MARALDPRLEQRIKESGRNTDCDLRGVTERLDQRDIEYEVHELAAAVGPDDVEHPMHAIQYFDERGQDTLLVTIGEGSRGRVTFVQQNASTLMAHEHLARIPVQVTGKAIQAAMRQASELGHDLTAAEAHFILEAARGADGGMLP